MPVVRWRKILCQGFLFFMHDDLFVKTMLPRPTPSHVYSHSHRFLRYFALASRSVRDFVAGAGDFQQLMQSDKSVGWWRQFKLPPVSAQKPPSVGTCSIEKPKTCTKPPRSVVSKKNNTHKNPPVGSFKDMHKNPPVGTCRSIYMYRYMYRSLNNITF